MSSADPWPSTWKTLGPKLVATLLGLLVIFTMFALIRRIVYLIIDHGRHPLETALLGVGIASAIYLFWQVRHDGLKFTWRVGPAAILESLVVLVIFYTIDLPMLPEAAAYLTAVTVQANVALDDRINSASAQSDQVRLWLAWDLDGSRRLAYAAVRLQADGLQGRADVLRRLGIDAQRARIRSALALRAHTIGDDSSPLRGTARRRSLGYRYNSALGVGYELNPARRRGDRDDQRVWRSSRRTDHAARTEA